MTGPLDPAELWRQAAEYARVLGDELDDERRKRVGWARLRRAMEQSVQPTMPNPFLLYAEQRAAAVHAWLRRVIDR